MNKVLKALNNFIVKHHKCENNTKLYSYTYHIDEFGRKTLMNVEYRCMICDKKIE